MEDGTCENVSWRTGFGGIGNRDRRKLIRRGMS